MADTSIQHPAPSPASKPATPRAVETSFPFHRLARTAARCRWWRPLVVGVVGAVFYIVLSLILTIPFAVLAFTAPDQFPAFMDLLTGGPIDLNDPTVFAYSLGSIALMLPSIWLATLLLGSRPVGLLSSVAGRVRWRWLMRCAGLALAVYFVVFGFSFLVLDPLLGAEPISPTVTASTALLIVLALIITPLQATAEEYVFRGYLMQTIGGWLKHPAWAILLPVPLFAIGHDYDLWGLADVAIFAIAAGWLTWRTGGLEAAIAAHVVNNTLLFVLGAFGIVDLNAKGGSPAAIAVTVVTMVSYSALVVWQAKRSSLAMTREQTPPLWASAPPPSVASPNLGV